MKSREKKICYVEVYSCYGEAQACLFKEFLVVHGIPATVISESLSGLSFFTTGTTAKARIIVPESLFEKARSLIAEAEASN